MLSEKELRMILEAKRLLAQLLKAHEPPSFAATLRAADERKTFQQDKLLRQAEVLRGNAQ